MSIQRLPIELLETICASLDFQSSAKLRLTCKFFTEAPAKILFSVANFRFCPESLEMLRCIANNPAYCKHIKKLILRGEPLPLLERPTAPWNLYQQSGLDESTPAGYLSVMPAMVYLDRPRLHQFTWQRRSQAYSGCLPIRKMGPGTNKLPVALDPIIEWACKFYDSDGNRITYNEWMGCQNGAVAAPVDSDRISDEHELFEEAHDEDATLQHHKCFFEQIMWSKADAEQLDAVVKTLPNLMEIVVCPNTLQKYQS